MGALHEGHLSMVRRAQNECRHVGVSIFVNPPQFGPGEDLELYPRDLDGDLERLESLGVDLVYVPTREEVYPDGFQTWVSVEHLSLALEGSHRPGHFRGVATIVAKLFNLFEPHRAYFGQKDAQQLAVIQRMVRDLNYELRIVGCPTVRAQDGLALSSRNAYLGPEERRAGAVLFRALSSALALYRKGESSGDVLRCEMSKTIAAEPLAREQYVSAADPESLAELDQVFEGALLSLAVTIGRVRLIDNMQLH
jgi:pantoate--beta-alanine ligase